MSPTAGLRRACAAAAFVALSISSPVAAQQIDQRAGAAVSTGSQIHIDNFGRVGSAYYRGAQPEGRDYAELAALGVKTLINLTADDAEPNEQAMAEQAGMTYVQIPMTTHLPPTNAQLAEFLTLVNDPARQPVYVHCVGGRHRTGVMTAAYRIAHEGWGADRAFREMKQYNFGADILHSEFKKFVYGYHPDAAHADASAVKAAARP
jgi:tyrosine-protein phosphatase SIW14